MVGATSSPCEIIREKTKKKAEMRRRPRAGSERNENESEVRSGRCVGGSELR